MSPSPTELVILQHLWTEGDSSAREIHDGIRDQLEWSFSSTRKTMDRMVEKGLLSVALLHGVRVFSPKQNKVAAIADMTKRFARDVLGLDAPLPVSTFARSRYLSNEDLEKLEKLLQEDDSDP